MRIHILSDLHLEFAAYTQPQVEADITILAGDTDINEKGVQWAMSTFPERPVLYVLGNHEYYGQAFPRLIQKLKSKTSGSNVHVLENDIFEINGVVFFGATLWTDFALNGDVLVSATVARTGMSDFRRIRKSPEFRRFSPADARHAHQQSREALGNFVNGGTGPRVVVSHHAPSPKSLRNGPKPDPLDPAYASDLEAFILEANPTLWIHGHIHETRDYMVGATRIINNCRGYPDEKVVGFRPDLVIEV